MTNADLQKVQEVKAKAQEIIDLVRNSLNLQAVGGTHIANELIGAVRKLGEVETAIEADIAAV